MKFKELPAFSREAAVRTLESVLLAKLCDPRLKPVCVTAPSAGKENDMASVIGEAFITLELAEVLEAAEDETKAEPQTYMDAVEAEPKTFEQAAEPLIKWMAENVHPHHSVIVTATGAELLEGQKCHKTTEFLVD